MRTRFPWRAVVVACVLLLFGYALTAPADDSPQGKPAADPSSIPEIDVELRAGSKLVGKLVEPITLEMDYGLQEVKPDAIRRITFRPPEEEHAADVIELKSHTILRGKIRNANLKLAVGDEIRLVLPSEIRELKSRHKTPVGLWAILFGLLTLTAMEIVLGIDNVIFLAIIAGKLPKEQQPRARKIGLIVALGTRLALLASLSFLLGLTRPLFVLPDLPLIHDLDAREVSLRDLILFLGGLFLIGKSTKEIHEKLESEETRKKSGSGKVATFGQVIFQIAVIDIIFSLDSVITAVGMVEELWVMVTAMVIAMIVMMVFAGTISDFVAKHPTLKILALSFLILIGVMLTAEALGQHMDKGYIYFAMAFAVIVELINLRSGGRHAKHHAKLAN